MVSKKNQLPSDTQRSQQHRKHKRFDMGSKKTTSSSLAFLMALLLSCSTMSSAARYLEETKPAEEYPTAPELPTHPTVPELPKPELPPHPTVPELPKPDRAGSTPYRAGAAQA